MKPAFVSWMDNAFEVYWMKTFRLYDESIAVPQERSYNLHGRHGRSACLDVVCLLVRGPSMSDFLPTLFVFLAQL